MKTIKTNMEQQIGELYARHGQITPSGLLDAARPADSPIHAAFEWDDHKAGHQFRLLQARRWIREVRVVIGARAERLVHVPVVRVQDDVSCEGFYKPASVVVQDADEYGRALSAVKHRLASAKESYDELKRAAAAHPPPVAPRFARADRGFSLLESALSV